MTITEKIIELQRQARVDRELIGRARQWVDDPTLPAGTTELRDACAALVRALDREKAAHQESVREGREGAAYAAAEARHEAQSEFGGRDI